MKRLLALFLSLVLMLCAAVPAYATGDGNFDGGGGGIYVGEKCSFAMDGGTITGNTATNATKPATLETGAEIKVPLFINPGDRIRVDTRVGEYLERAKA